MHSMLENCLGSTYAASITQSDFTSAKKPLLDRMAVPNVCTSISYPIQLYIVKKYIRSPFLDPYKNILQNVHNLTKPRTYSNWVRHFLTFSHLSSPVITNRNQHFSERRHLLSPWLCKWKCFWWRTQKHQPSKFFPKVWSVAVSNKIASIGQSYKTESTEKEIVWQNLDQRECTLKT